VQQEPAQRRRRQTGEFHALTHGTAPAGRIHFDLKFDASFVVMRLVHAAVQHVGAILESLNYAIVELDRLYDYEPRTGH